MEMININHIITIAIPIKITPPAPQVYPKRSETVYPPSDG